MKYRSILFLFCTSLALGACSLAEDITPPPNYQPPTPVPTLGALFPSNLPDLAAGQAIYVEKCAPCHGTLGLGDGPTAANLPQLPSALGKPQIALVAVPAQWYTVVTQGNMSAFMPPFTSLSDQQRWDVVAYALSLSTTPQQLVEGQAIYQANCAECHGADGKQSAGSDFTNQALMSKLSQNNLINAIGSGTGTTSMPAFENKLSLEQRSAVAAYLRTFTFAPAQVASAPGPTATLALGEATPTLVAQSAENTGVISGKVTNGSAAALPAGLKAVLHVFEHDPTNSKFTEISSRQTPLDPDGSFVFSGQSMPASRAFYVSVDYAGTTYSSDPVTPAPGQSAYDLPVTIYDTTDDATALVVDQVHILLDYSKPAVIQAVEYFVISNPGTKTIIAKNKGDAIVSVALPKGYSNLQIQDGQLGDRYLQTADGFADTAPVLPGKQQYQLIFAFDLPYTSSFEFSQPFALNISAITFLVSEGVTAAGPNLADGGVKDMGNGGGRYQLYAAGSRKTGETLSLTVSGSSVGTAPTMFPAGDLGRYLLIGIGLIGVILVLGSGWLYFRDRKRLPADAPQSSRAEDGNTDEILEAIIALDDQHAAGNIGDAAYQQRRAELKAKLQGKL
jgi:mono/diheme cytochrome c family protein